MNNIESNLTYIRSGLPSHVKLIAVSKNHPIDSIFLAYQAGQKNFGENKVQELIQKQPLLPKDIEWHLIGHLQSNKVKYIVPFVHLIHGVDSLNLLMTINKEAQKINRNINCLLQMHIAKEETKFGLSMEETISILNSIEFTQLKNIHISGLMGMATFTDDTKIIRSEFHYLADYFKKLKAEFFKQDESFNELSMGMSDDYLIAIEEGSTMIRIGTAIFGKRK